MVMAKKCLLVGVLVVLLVFTSCSVSNDQSNSVAKVQGKQDYLYLISNYSDGVAWVNYCDATAKDKTREGVHPKCGCINKNGELIFYYDSTDITHSLILLVKYAVLIIWCLRQTMDSKLQNPETWITIVLHMVMGMR